MAEVFIPGTDKSAAEQKQEQDLVMDTLEVSTETNRRAAAVIMGIHDGGEPEDFFNAEDRARLEATEDLFQEVADKQAETERAVFSQEMSSILGTVATSGDTEALKNIAEAAVEVGEEIDRGKDHPAAADLAAAKSVSKDVELTFLEQDALRMYLGREIARGFEETGTYETGRSLITEIVGFDTAFDLKELFGKGMPAWKIWGGLEGFKKFHTIFWQSDWETQGQLARELVKTLDEDENINVWERANILSLLGGSSEDIRNLDLQILLDATILGEYAAIIARGLSGTGKLLGGGARLWDSAGGWGRLRNIDTESAVEALAESIRNPKARSTAGVDDVDAAQVLLGGSKAHTDQLSTPGRVYGDVGPDIRATLDGEGADIRARMKSVLDRLTNPEASGLNLRESILTQGEIIKTIENGVEMGKKVGRYKDYQVDNIEVLAHNLEGATVRYRATSTAPSGAITQQFREETVKFTLDDVTGQFHLESTGPATRGLGSPQLFLKKDNVMVKAVTRLQDLGAVVRADYNRIINSIVKKVPVKSQTVVNKVLMSGDEFGNNGKVYTVSELQAGVRIGDEIITLSAPERTVYYNMVEAMDGLWSFFNWGLRRRKEVSGFKGVKVHVTESAAGPTLSSIPLTNEKGYATMLGAKKLLARVVGKEIEALDPDDLTRIEKLRNGHFRVVFDDDTVKLVDDVAKPFETAGAAISSLQRRFLNNRRFNNIVPRAWHGLSGAKGESVALTPQVIQNIYKDGFILARLDEVQSYSGKPTHYLVVRGEDLTDLPQHVLHKRNGYIPRINNEAKFAVIRETPFGDQVVAYTNRANDASIITRAKNAEAGRGIYKMSSARDSNIPAGDDMISNAFGGLYYSRRSADEIPYFNNVGEWANGITNKAPRESVFRAISAAAGHIQRVLPMGEWRLSMQKRWLNSANTIAMRNGLSLDEFLDNPLDFNAKILVEVPEKNALEKTRSYVNFVTNVPTEQETKFSSLLFDWSKTLEHSAWGDKDLTIPFKQTPVSLRRTILNASHMDPYNALKTVAFHSTLGLFNPSQLIVQGMGSINVLALVGPVKYPILMRQYLGLKAASIIDERAPGTKALMPHIARSAGFDLKRFEELRQLFKDSGIWDAVHTTADIQMAAQGRPIGSSALRNVFKTGTVFYNEGERFNKGMALLFALEKQGFGKGMPMKGINLRNAVDEAYRVAMNLTRGNQSLVQKGFLGVLTQFEQVFWKFMENVSGINRAWTLEERGRIIFTQLLLFGTASIPFMDNLINAIGAGAGVETGSDTEAVLAQLRRGGLGAILDLTGTHITITNRLSFMGNTDTFFANLAEGIKEGDIQLRDVVGAAGNVLIKGKKVFSSTLLPVSLAMFDEEYELTAGEVVDAFASMSEIFSSFSNAQKGLVLSNTIAQFDKRGRQIAVPKDREFSLAEQVATVLGFPLADLERYYEQKRIVGDKEQTYRDLTRVVTEDLQRHFNFIMQTLKVGDVNDDDHERAVAAVHRRLQIYARTMGVTEEQYQKNVMPRVLSNLTNTSNAAGELYVKFLDLMAEEETINIKAAPTALGRE